MTIAYWLSELHECSIVPLQKDVDVARHTTLRSTGLVHRPYYLDPVKNSLPRSVERSYDPGRELASRDGVPRVTTGRWPNVSSTTRLPF